MNKIWIFLIISSILYGIYSHNVDAMKEAIMQVPRDTLNLILVMGGFIVFYNGLFNIAVKSGLIKSISRFFSPLIKLLFPNLPTNHPTREYISGVFVANFLGLGIASTPMCLKAMSSLQELNKNKDTASNEMITLLILNISSFTIMPITILSIREQMGAKNSIFLMLIVGLITFTITVVTLLVHKLICKVKGS